jgi:threonine synthase
VVLVDGLISEAAGMAGEKARAEGWFDLSTFKEPYRLEGKKIMGYEIAQDFQWDLPDVIVYPTGGGTGLVGIWKAIAELAELGWLETKKRPRMVVVQAEGCAPVVKAFDKKAAFCDFWTNAHTQAAGLRVPKSFADRLILSTIYESNGTAIAVSDEAIFQAQHEIATREGLFVAPEGAATLAALKELVKKKWIQPDDNILLLNTGSGLKYLDLMK